MRVAVFGRPGGGKSTLAERIARATELSLYQVELLRFEEGGAQVRPETFSQRGPTWVLDGLASPGAFEAMVDRATVLAYVEKPVWVHQGWVIKRFVLSPFKEPRGWPKNSPMWASTLASFRHLRLSDGFWTAALLDRLVSLRVAKRVYVVRSAADERALLDDLHLLRTRTEA